MEIWIIEVLLYLTNERLFTNLSAAKLYDIQWHSQPLSDARAHILIIHHA